MYRITCLVVCSVSLFSILATEVTIYNYYEYTFTDPQDLKPAAVSQFPWKFGYVGSDVFYIFLYISNKLPSVTAINVTYTTGGDITYKMKKFTRTNYPRKIQDYYYYVYKNIYRYGPYTTEIKIKLNLYTSNIVCASFLVVQGRNVANITNEPLKKEFPRYNCGGSECAVVVDLASKCVGPLLVTRTTTKPFTDVVNSNNKTFTNNVLNTSQNENIDTTTVKNAGNTTNADHTDFTIIIIAVISSISGTLLILLLAIWKRGWCKRSPSGTPQLPPYEPFYLNMLFRRECDQEIAEIDQHQYEEIIPQVTEGS